MARLDLTFQDVYSQVADFLGVGTAPTGDTLTKVKNLVYRAYRQFLYPTFVTDEGKTKQHQWSWLKRDYVLHTESGKYKYQLPVDFGRMLQEPTFGKESGYGPLTKVSCEMIDNNRALSQTSSYPFWYAIKPLPVDVDQEQLWELWLWPSPNGAFDLKFIYQVNPNKPESDSDYFLGGPESGEVIMEMAMGIAEQQEDDLKTTHHTEMGQKLLRDLIVRDTYDVPETVGKVLRRPVHYFQYGFTSISDNEIYLADH